MPREVQQPTVNEHGDEVHPAFGRVILNRRSSTPGSVLFDSEIQHNHTVVLTLHEATRKRDLHHDWIHPDKHVVEIEMSEAQWASMVSSFGSGGGTSCTIRYRQGEGLLPDLPFEPRLALSMAETKTAAVDAVANIQAAFDALEAIGVTGPVTARRAAMRDLQIALGHVGPNVEFASKSLVEHTENVVQKARADIEAMVLAKAHELALGPGDVEQILAIAQGDTIEED